MSAKEAKARIKIIKLLEEAGWRFFDDSTGKVNIVLEPNVKLTVVNKLSFVLFVYFVVKGFNQ